MKSLNLGILAHVDAGKTSLTERLLFAAGVIDQVGRVDDGNTQTDSLALERQRGITIKSAVASFVIGDVTVNLIDTPGHPDFIAEVERVLSLLDGVVLVISAVEGVQAQTRVLMRALQRLHLPVVIFVNKIDRAGARYGEVLQSIERKLAPAVIAMGSVSQIGSRAAEFVPHHPSEPGFAGRLADVVTRHDDALLAAYVEESANISPDRLRAELAAQTKRALVQPVFFGSAITGAGTDALAAGIAELLPSNDRAVDGPVSGSVFKIERGPAGDRIAFVRMSSGTVHVRDSLSFGPGLVGKATAISVFEGASVVPRPSLAAGQIGKVWGLGEIQIGDPIGTSAANTLMSQRFSPPTLETIVVPTRPADSGALYAALTQLDEQDPLITLRMDRSRQEIALSLYGEVQKEVIGATLAVDYGLDVTFRESTTIHIERPTGSGAAAETIGQVSNPYLATVGLRIEPAPIDSGVAFQLEVELGSMPLAFFKAVEETVHEALGHGLHGWRVTDCTVTMTRSGYWARQSRAHGGFDKSMSSTAGDFRNLTPLVLLNALRRAGTEVCEPIQRFQLEIPADTLGPLSPVLARLHAVPHTATTQGASTTLEGEIPAAWVSRLQQQLPGLTRGEGVLECVFDHYRPAQGADVPSRQ
jgi:ribosomal protection tetracycline resistance protein